MRLLFFVVFGVFLIFISRGWPQHLPLKQRTATHDGAKIVWSTETRCEGFKAGDCSVRSPQTAYVTVTLPTKIVKQMSVRCRNRACDATPEEFAVWIKMASKQSGFTHDHRNTAPQ